MRKAACTRQRGLLLSGPSPKAYATARANRPALLCHRPHRVRPSAPCARRFRHARCLVVAWLDSGPSTRGLRHRRRADRRGDIDSRVLANAGHRVGDWRTPGAVVRVSQPSQGMERLPLVRSMDERGKDARPQRRRVPCRGNASPPGARARLDLGCGPRLVRPVSSVGGHTALHLGGGRIRASTCVDTIPAVLDVLRRLRARGWSGGHPDSEDHAPRRRARWPDGFQLGVPRSPSAGCQVRGTQNGNQITAMFEALAFSGTALMIAGFERNSPGRSR